MELESMRQQINHYEEFVGTLKDKIKELTSYKNECELKQEENDLLRQQLLILENQYQMEKDSLKVKDIFQRDMENYTKLQTEVISLRSENERLRPQCGKILILQEKLESATEKNTKLENQLETLTKELEDYKNGSELARVSNQNQHTDSVMISETINQLSESIKQKNEQLLNSQSEIQKLKINLEKMTTEANNHLNAEAKYKTKCKQYKENYEKMKVDHEKYVRENVSYKELLDNVMKMQNDDKKIYLAIQEAFNQKLRVFIRENERMKSALKNNTKQDVDIPKDENNKRDLVLSLSNSPYEIHVKNSLTKLKEAYQHNRILVNSLKMSKKLAYWKEKKLLPTQFIDEVKRLPTAQSFHDMKEKCCQMEKLLEQIKIACSDKILQVKKDLIQILGYDIEFDSSDSCNLKLLSVFAPDKTDHIVFKRESNGSYSLCDSSENSVYSSVVVDALSQLKNDVSIKSSPWPVFISHLTLKLFSSQHVSTM